MGVWRMLFKSVEIKPGGGGSYNLSTGVVKHPPKGSKGSVKVKGRGKTEQGKR